MQTVAAGKCQNGLLRYWLSVGRGDFELSTKMCTEALLYACLVEEDVVDEGASDGVKVCSPLVQFPHFLLDLEPSFGFLFLMLTHA